MKKCLFCIILKDNLFQRKIIQNTPFYTDLTTKNSLISILAKLLAVKLNIIMNKRVKSAALYEEAKQYFPGGVNSPVRAFKSVYGPPLFIKKGEGCYLFDEDDNQFIDFCCSWGH